MGLWRVVSRSCCKPIRLFCSFSNIRNMNACDEQSGLRACLQARHRRVIHTIGNLFDVDCNLTHNDLKDQVEEHLLGAKAAGVSGMVVPGSTLEESRACLDIAERFGTSQFHMKTTVGVHPYHAEEWQNNTLSALRKMMVDNALVVAAVGECGLDYSEGFPDRVFQLPVFEAQVQMACELNLPLFVHQRGAFADFVEVMNRYRTRCASVPVLVHCFTGDQKELDWILSQDNYFLSFSGIICKHERGQSLRQVLEASRKRIALTRVMVETDAPYLGFPGCRAACETKKKKQYPNVPSALPHAVKALAACLHVDPALLAAETSSTARKFFNVSQA